MTADAYSAAVRQLFARTEHGGDLEGATSAGAEDQGVRIVLSVRHDDGTIRELRFRAWGCPHLIAACEAFCRDHEGQSVAGLEGFEASEIMRNLSIPAEKTGRILVLEDTVRSLGRSICGSAVTRKS